MTSRSRTFAPLLLITILATVLPGCAAIKVRKIPHPTSYSLAADCTENVLEPCWNELQTRGDAIEGARYYLPRPWVVVKQEFPVGGGTHYVSGRIDKDGRIVEIDSIPEALKGILPEDGSIGLSEIREGRDEPAAPDEPQLSPQAEAIGGEGDGAKEDGKDEEKETPKLQADVEKLLEGSTVQPADVASRDGKITLTAKVKKEAFAEGKLGAGTSLEGKLYLVPIREGKHAAEGLLEVKEVAVQGTAGENRTLVGLVTGKDVPPHASLGVGFKTNEGETVILHTTGPDVHSSFAAAPKKSDEKKMAEDEDGAEKKVVEAKATTSGDPATDPLIKLSPLFDVLLLPDFSQQYAIQVRSGVFKASASLGFENGWMAEKLNFDIDNSALGEFLIDTAEAIVTQGLSELFPTMEAVEEGMEQESAEATMKQESEALEEDQQLRVLLRIDHVELAVPGIYPLVKEAEQECGHAFGVRSVTCAPEVNFEPTRKLTVIQVVETAQEDAGPSPVSCNSEAVIRREVRSLHGDSAADGLEIVNEPTGEVSIVLPASVDLAEAEKTELKSALDRALDGAGCNENILDVRKGVQ